LRSDNGGEYTSNGFNDFYKEAGRKRELTVPYNPQKNEVVERKNQFIVGAAKVMPIEEQGCRKEESIHHWRCQGDDS
jgi:transposase InsO family protein